MRVHQTRLAGLDAGQRGFHFYTLNLERSTRLILEGLGFVAPIEQVKPLPWNPSLAKNREKETVRPIFWRNRPKSYIQRTEQWDEFPNGRWGDSRSPGKSNATMHSPLSLYIYIFELLPFGALERKRKQS
jgi:hypothetical protein